MVAVNICLSLLAILASIGGCQGSIRSQALVTELPGLKHDINFKHYSGYLSASRTHRLHYWFVESQRDPANDPLLIWMNGGPGCSSLDGMLNELGPFKINDDGTTVDKNPFAWNLMANVIFLEAPAGVGFSYATDGNVTSSDDQTSAENYAALKMFYSIFPAYRNSELYVGGESYAGVYVPSLVKRILDGNNTYPVNIKGMYIGNGFLDKNLNTDTLVEYGYMHGIMSEHDWDFAQRTCCNGCSDFCPFYQAKGGLCHSIVSNLIERIWIGGLNPYDMYRDCAFSSEQTRHRVLMNGLTPPHLRHRLNSALSKQLSSAGTEAGQPNCMNDTSIEMYLNNPAVQRALHVEGHIHRWTMCSVQVEGTYVRQYTSMKPHVEQALKKGLRVLIYNGDTDMACNFLLGQRFVQSLDLELQLQKKMWHHQKQVAGFWTKYKGLDFLTVKGAGHMVPQWRPAQAFHMMYRYLENKPY